jgi:hypothetical protein
MAKAKQIELAEYWTGIHAAFQSKFASIAKAIQHPISGASPEKEFRKLFSDYLPRRYVVEPGFVADADKKRSPHIDLLIVDCEHIPPLYLDEPQSVFATEAVVAAIEITSAPKQVVKQGGKVISKFEADLLKLSEVRTMGAVRRYRESVFFKKKGGITYNRTATVLRTPGPRAWIVTCGDEWKKPETYKANLVTALKSIKAQNRNIWLHGAFSLRHGMLAFKPYTEFEGDWIVDNALLEFVFQVNIAISSFETGKINLQRYRPIAPKVSEKQ